MDSRRSQGHAPSGHLAALDALRGGAAICVVIHHISRPFAPQAYLAVDFFFMLSGYIVGRAYEDRLRRGLSVSAFMGQVRWMRLWPTMGLGMALGLAVTAAGHGQEPFRPVDTLNLLLIPTFGTGVYPLNNAAWSILFELAANLLHALLLPVLTTPRLIIGVLVAGMAMLWVNGQVDSWNFGWMGGPASPLFLLGVLRAGFAYGVGLLLFRLTKDRRLPVMSDRVAPLFLLALLLLPRADGGVSLVLTVLVGWPLVLLAGLCARPRSSPLGRWLGGISFPLYATHLPLLHLVSHLAPGAPLAAFGFWLAMLGLTLCVATLVWRCFDAPARRWLAHRLSAPDGGAGLARAVGANR